MNDIDYIELTNPYRANAVRALQELTKINSVFFYLNYI